jgi:outer membrane protein TolC
MVLSVSTLQRACFRALFAILTVAAPRVGRAQAPDVAGTMPEDFLPELKAILATALQRSPQLVAAEFERSVQEARIYGADSARLPALRGASEFATNQTAASGSSSSQSRASGFFYRFEASQAVYHWGALKNQSQAARLSLLVAEKNHALAQRELATIVRKAYLGLIVEKARLQQGREALDLLRADLKILTEKKEAGLVSSSALEGEKLREREVAADLERGETEFAANRRRLARLAGQGELPEERITGELPSPARSAALTAALTAALQRDGARSTLEYEIYDLRVREATLRHSIERTRLLPKFNLGASYSLENNTDVNNNVVNQQAFQRQTVSLGAQWSIFDGLATRGAIREALAVKRVNERNLAIRVEQTLQDAQSLARSLKLDVEQAELADIRQGMAIEGRRRIAVEVELGNLARGNLARAELNLAQARAKSLETRAAYFGRWSDLVALAGRDPVLATVSARHDREKN